MNIERFKENLEILKQHNITHIPVYHLTDGQTHEVDLINAIVEDGEELLKNREKGMKIDLDTPVSIGDSIFFFDNVLARHEAKVEAIHIQYLRPHKEPHIEIDWVQYDENIDGNELWDSGTVELDDLGNNFWLTYEDMVKANQDEFEDYMSELREREQEGKY